MKPQQNELFHEDFRDALRHCISALGGPKSVGSELWPSVGVEQARTRLNNCLDINRAEKLDLDEVIWILKASRKKRVHSAIAHLLSECGYAPPQPIEPEDERARLQRQYIEATKVMSTIAERMERFSSPEPSGKGRVL